MGSVGVARVPDQLRSVGILAVAFVGFAAFSHPGLFASLISEVTSIKATAFHS